MDLGRKDQEQATEAGQRRSAPPAGLTRLALLTAGSTFALIFLGGLVTSTGSALAVPDWPLAFGRLVPRLVGGVRFEYTHRVVAAVVVLLTCWLAAWAAWSEPRVWVRRLAWGAVGLVVAQAVLGGITVLYGLPLAVAVTHAAVAQGFFALVVGLATVLDPAWSHPGGGPEPARAEAAARLCGAVSVAAYLQILLGAVMRHLGAGLAIPDFPLSFGRLIPPFETVAVEVNFAHRVGALAVTLLALWASVRVLRLEGAGRFLCRPARALLAIVALQLCLGAFTVWSGRAVIVTTAHVATGAAVLAASVMLTLRCWARARGHGQEAVAGAPAGAFARGADALQA